MSSTIQPAPPDSTGRTKRVRDRRAFWRILLAVILPLPMLAKGIHYMLSPVGGDVTFTETVTALEAHPDMLETLKWLDAVFVVGLIPATIALAWVARRGAPPTDHGRRGHRADGLPRRHAPDGRCDDTGAGHRPARPRPHVDRSPG